MNFFFLFQTCIKTLFEVLEQKKGNATVNYIISAANTVQFITADVYALDELGNWNKQKDLGLMVQLEIYNFTQKQIVFSDKKPAADTNFFYTTPEHGKYYIVASVLGENVAQYKKLGLDVKIYTGEESMPVIVSNGDVELNKAENFVKRVLDYAKNNLVLQDMEFEDDKKYRTIYDGILKTAFYLMFLKLGATLFTLYYSNLKTKQFFEAQNLGDQN
ncbi:hypothetical protein NUSPORA_02882 [Nucleospora cyclopteri]